MLGTLLGVNRRTVLILSIFTGSEHVEDDIDQSIEDVLTGLQYIFVSVFGSLQKATTVYFDKTIDKTNADPSFFFNKKT